jgi:hypothetical protein
MNKLPVQNQPQGPVAFLSFSTRKDAELAKEKFQGFQIDPHAENITLKIEFAKANTKSRYRNRETNSMAMSHSPLTYIADGGQALQTFPILQPQIQHCQPITTPVAIDTGAVWVQYIEIPTDMN